MLNFKFMKDEIDFCGYKFGSICIDGGKFDFIYGKVEVKVKFLLGDGLWLVIWMMFVSLKYGGWFVSGEIDIMEYIKDLDVVV